MFLNIAVFARKVMQDTSKFESFNLGNQASVWECDTYRGERAQPGRSGCNKIAAVNPKQVYESINKLIVGFLIVVSYGVD